MARAAAPADTGRFAPCRPASTRAQSANDSIRSRSSGCRPRFDLGAIRSACPRAVSSPSSDPGSGIASSVQTSLRPSARTARAAASFSGQHPDPRGAWSVRVDDPTRRPNMNLAALRAPTVNGAIATSECGQGRGRTADLPPFRSRQATQWSCPRRLMWENGPSDVPGGAVGCDVRRLVAVALGPVRSLGRLHFAAGIPPSRCGGLRGRQRRRWGPRRV